MRGSAWMVGLVAVLGLTQAGAYPAGREQDARSALRQGRYEEAIQLAGQQAARDPGSAEARRVQVATLLEVGRHAEAERAARDFVTANPVSAELWNLFGEALHATGRIQEAEDAFSRAIAGGASDALDARANLAVSRNESGDGAGAQEGFEALVAAYNAGGRLSSKDLTAVATACRYLGRDDPQAFKDAVKAYDEAIAADPDDVEPRVKLGELFLEKYNSPDAEQAFKEALSVNPAHPGALLGSARRLEFDGGGDPGELVRRSLEVNPRFVEARVFLARHALEVEDYPEAAREAEAALEVNPASLEALAVLAAARHFQGDREGYEEARRRALGRNPQYADLYNTVAELLVQNRFYREAVEFAGKAVELDPRSWRGHGILGLNQLRVGAIEEGRRSLEASFAGDPYNVWIKNTLDLLDTFPEYVETTSPRFRFFVHRREAELLGPYLAELAEEAYDRLSERYGYRPPTPIRVEVYPSHADFSVRTVGLAGLGALGVCFGPVLALDSPSAREQGTFNWGSTLWHELAHTVTLGMTEHRVPRWLTEGLSVLEERRARPGWGDDVSFDFLAAHKAGKLLPIADLNDGFVSPDHPGRVALSYYQASLVVELIERDHGFTAVLGLLKAYRAGTATPGVFQGVLGTDLPAFDRRFEAYLAERFGAALAAVRLPPAGQTELVRAIGPPPAASAGEPEAGDFRGQLRKGRALFEEKKLDEALPYLERAKALFPEYAEADSPYWLLAAIRKEKDDPRGAAEELGRLVALNENHYRAHVELADLRESLGELAAAAAALEGAVYIYPFDLDLHERLAGLHAKLGDGRKAVRERQAVVAMAPVDRPEALYQLALAHLEAGDAAAARREVLRALELAPRFDKAQDLLLRLRRGGPGSSGGAR